MASNRTQPNTSYDPVPPNSYAAEHIEMTHTPSPHNSPLQRYNPDLDRSQNSTPVPPNLDDLPPGAALGPRFYGMALRDDGPYPSPYGHSYNASTASSAGFDSYHAYDQSSIHALNPTTEDVTTYGRYNDSHMRGESPYHDDYANASTTEFFPAVRPTQGRLLEEKNRYYASPQQKTKRKGILVCAIITAIIAVLAIVAIPIYIFVIRKHTSPANTSSGDSGSNTQPQTPISVPVVSGGDGSKVTLSDGSTFTYQNSFGGYWYEDPNAPFTNAAKAQSWTPALNETFNWGVDKIRGVNIGGWLVTEPFIVPALYEKYYNTSSRPIDEWTLSQAMANANALSDLEEHYKTFITEEDFAQIAGAGLNFVRIPIPYWAIEVRPGEPFLPKTAWTYFLKAIQWARKYGIRINLDLHAVPGSQNGWNHSGRLGSMNFLYGVAGIFNAQRTLEYVRVIAEFIAQPQYRDVVVMFGVVNEPRAAPYIGTDVLATWYFEAYSIIRNITGIGAGNGPFISVHDGFSSLSNWAGVFPNVDRVALDTHPYIAFGDTQSTNPPSAVVQTPCKAWGNMMNDSLGAFGLTAAGEFSLAINDCGQWVNGVDLGARYDGTFQGSTGVGSCDTWNNWQTWTPDIKQGFHDFALTSMDALQNYFFWTWKIGNSSVTGRVEAPFWSYQLGLQNGWMPKDPTVAVGACAAKGASADAFKGPLASWQTGGVGAGQVPASAVASLQWPPQSISGAGAVSLLPSYTPTGPVPTLPAPTFTPLPSASITASIDAGNGWFDPQDVLGGFVEISGCSYPDPWGGSNIPMPTAPCSGPAAKREAAPEAQITPPPSRS
jgi:glucan 1,3-beta-glucosidase